MSFVANRGLPLVVKLVKPIKVAGSGFADKFGLDKVLVAQAEAQAGAAQAAVLGEADATVGGEEPSLDLGNGLLDQLAVLLALLLANRGLQVLDFRLALAHEHHQGHLGDAADPGRAD